MDLFVKSCKLKPLKDIKDLTKSEFCVLNLVKGSVIRLIHLMMAVPAVMKCRKIKNNQTNISSAIVTLKLNMYPKQKSALLAVRLRLLQF